MRMTKILIVIGSLRRDGAQLRTLDVCRVLRQRHPIQFDFCVLGRQPVQLKAEVDSIGGAIYYVPIRSPRFIIQFSHLLRKGRYDVVNSFPLLISGVIAWLAKSAFVPIRIVNFRNSLGHSGKLKSNFLFIWLMRFLIKHSATHIVAVSRTALDSVFPPPWQSLCDCRVIYNGLSLPSFQNAVKSCEVRKEFGWPPGSKIVINVARFFSQKNHRAILEAIRLAYERNHKIRLLLVGNGKLVDDITSLINFYGLQHVCTMAGVRNDVPRLLLASDIFLFPSLWEGLPGALLEALAAGLPAVTSDIPPIREIAEYFPNSILMSSPNNARLHAEHILMALENPFDQVLAQENFLNSPFILENSVKAYSDLYGLTNTYQE